MAICRASPDRFTLAGLSRANLQKLLEEDPAVRELLRGLVQRQHETTVSLRKGHVAGDED